MNSSARLCLVSLFLLMPVIGFAEGEAPVGSCDSHVAQWLDPVSGESIVSEQLFERLADSRIVLLGEAHTSAAHHQWQLYMLAALHSRNPDMMVGFEMLPRRAQPVLDAWSAGEISQQAFLEQSEWQKVWGYDADLYMPLLQFTRQNRLPGLALNIDRELVSRVGQQGWHGIEESERMGLSDPAPASDAYRESLARLYAYKQTLSGETQNQADNKEPDLDEIKASEAFANFVDAQLTWDRAMAEALAAAHRRDPSAIVVGIIGRGHLEYGHGIPHQLADMGIEDVDVLLPLDSDDNCDPLPMDLASAVFVVEAEVEAPAPARPRLGIIIEGADEGVRVMQVVEDSVAAATGIREGDVIQAAAGFATSSTSDLIEVIQRQAPGTWLPLQLLRDGKEMDLLAKFPQSFE
jgi:uncharacterized iron-regulated protein